MSFTPQYGKALSPDEATRFQNVSGRVGRNLPPQQKQSSIMKAANGIVDFVGARGITNQFGSSIARAGLNITSQGDAADLVGNPSLKEVSGSALQTGANFIPAARGLNLAGKVVVGGATGQAIDSGSDLQQGDSVGDSLRPGASTAAGGVIPFAGDGFRAFGSLLERGGKKIQFSVIKPTQADIKDGFKIETLSKYKLGGSLQKTLEKSELKLNELSRQLDAMLTGSKLPVDLTENYEMTVKKLLGNKVDNFGVNNKLESSLERLRSEVSAVAGDNGLVDLKQANRIKRAAGHMGAWQFGKVDPEAAADEKVYNTFYSTLRQSIENASPSGVKEINSQMGEIIPVVNATIRRIPVAERNNLISLSETLSLVGAGINPSLGLLTVANILSRSGQAGKGIEATGKAIQNANTTPVGNTVNKLQSQIQN